MKTLTRAILKDYEVDLRRPSWVRGVQFGLSPAMLGLIDRRIDEANERGADIGLAAQLDALRTIRQQLGVDYAQPGVEDYNGYNE